MTMGSDEILSKLLHLHVI